MIKLDNENIFDDKIRKIVKDIYETKILNKHKDFIPLNDTEINELISKVINDDGVLWNDFRYNIEYIIDKYVQDKHYDVTRTIQRKYEE